MKPYVYIATGKSRDVQREAPTGARVAIHYPEIGRTIEIQTDARGNYHVTDRPAPGHGGESFDIARGTVDDEVEDAWQGHACDECGAFTPCHETCQLWGGS